MSQNFVFCQEEENSATIIFNDSTTVKGYGEIKKNKIYFSLTQNDEKTEWSYDIAKGIIFSGYGFSEKYEYIKPDKYSEPILAEVIEEGKINLYRKNNLKINVGHFNSDSKSSFSVQQHANAMRSANTHYDVASVFYVMRPFENNATDITFSFKTRAMKYFSDCEIIIKKLKNRTFNTENIPQMVTYYNDYCDGQED